MTRVILHADMDAFYAAIEQRDQPELAGRPVIVGGLGPRGVVATASYEARRFGVHSAMPTARARRLCPQGCFLRPRMEAYTAVSDQVLEEFLSFTDLVEPLSLDEAFLDVTGSVRLFGDGPEIARALRRRVAERTGLTVSVGVASTKYVAKVASDLHKPDGLTVVPPGGEREFLAPLPVRRLWGAGRVLGARLEALGLATLGDVASAPVERLTGALGEAAGRHLHALSLGLDERDVLPEREARSVSRETTFAQDVSDDGALRSVLLGLAEDVGRRLRASRLKARTVRLKLRYPPFETLLRQQRLPAASDDDLLLYRTALALLDATRPAGRPVRLLGLGTSDFEGAPGAGVQLELFTPRSEAAARVNRTLDAIRERFGPSAAGRAGAPGG